MIPKEKAEQLVKKYIELLKETDTCLIDSCPNMIICQHSWYMCEGWLSYAKHCALIAVAEIFEYLTTSSDVQVSMFAIEYWQQVEQEIEKL
jgi:hypothetical protein